MKLPAGKLLQHFKENTSPVYLLSGEESFLKEELVKKIVSTLPPESLDFDYDIFHGGENSGEDIVSQALTFPFGSSHRLIVVKSAELLKKEDREKILTYVENPSASTYLILLADIKNTRDSFFSKVAQKAVEVDFRTMYDNEIPAWLRKRALLFEKQLSTRAAYELKEHAGTDLRLLASELEKLSIQVGDRKEIEAEDVETSVGESKLRTGFEFADAIVEKKATLALKVLSSLLQHGKTAAEIIGLLAWQFRRIWKAKIYMEKGMRGPEIAKELRIPYFHIRKLVSYTERFSHSRLEEIFSALLETDIKAKTGESPALALELLVIRLCRQ